LISNFVVNYNPLF